MVRCGGQPALYYGFNNIIVESSEGDPRHVVRSGAQAGLHHWNTCTSHITRALNPNLAQPIHLFASSQGASPHAVCRGARAALHHGSKKTALFFLSQKKTKLAQSVTVASIEGDPTARGTPCGTSSLAPLKYMNLPYSPNPKPQSESTEA